MNLWEVLVRPVGRCEEQRYQELMREHHYRGCLSKISETLCNIALWRDQMDSPFEFFPRSLEVRGTGSLDRLEPAPSV